NAGPLTAGQFQRSYRDSLSPYSYVSASSQSHSTLPSKGSDRTPVPSRTWQNSLGLVPGHMEASATFSDKGVAFPVLQRFPTEVTYTLQPSASPMHVQQGAQTVATSPPKYSSYTSSVQYSQAYYPTAVLQCCSPNTHIDPLSGCATPTASAYTHCNFFQNPPMQSSYTVEFLPSNWPCSTADENKKSEVNLEAVFQIVDEMHSSPKVEMVKVEPVESQCSTPQPSKGQQLLVNAENSETPLSTEASRLEPLTPVGSDITSFVMGTDSLSQPSDFLYALHTPESVESASAQLVQERVTAQEAHGKLKEQLDHSPSLSSIVFVQEEQPVSAQQLNPGVKCPPSLADTGVPSEQIGIFMSGTGPMNKLVKDTMVSQARNRERRSNSQKGKSP
ncbi:HSF5 protein, partial [Nothocercus nigrocapillus]|nr:HSF5 protein [Nothocercus nigrocapillus]